MKTRRLPHPAEMRDKALGWYYRSHNVLASGEASFSGSTAESYSMWLSMLLEIERGTGMDPTDANGAVSDWATSVTEDVVRNLTR